MGPFCFWNLKGVAPGRLAEEPDFRPNPGRFRAPTYVPDSIPAGAPLIVVLHDCSQSAAEYDTHLGWSRLAENLEFTLLFPEQRRSNNAALCFN